MKICQYLGVSSTAVIHPFYPAYTKDYRIYSRACENLTAVSSLSQLAEGRVLGLFVLAEAELAFLFNKVCLLN